MNRTSILNPLSRILRVGLATLLLCLGGQARAVINGTMGEATGTSPNVVRTFTLTARHDFISTADGNSHYAWGYAHGNDFQMQYPGPTMIVNQGDTVKIVLNNALPVPVSIVFPGLQGVTATGGNPGLLTREARAVPVGENAVVGGPTYTFVADKPGTYLYHSGTNTDLQVEMGLVGALIVRPSGFVPEQRFTWKAYAQPGTNFDRETLFLLTEMDTSVHWQVYTQVFSGQPIGVDTTKIKPTVWFINGRSAPDTELDEYVEWLPTQPYNALPRMHPGERLLMRVVNAGRDLHPFHHHGNHATAIARDAQVLSSNPADLSKAPDLTSPGFTVRSVPGQTVDLIYEWTGKGIGWDIYGTTAENPHTCNPDGNGFHSGTGDINYREWCADHNKPIPVIIPGQLDISYGEYMSGSPFLGMTGSLPQGHPGLNATGGHYHMWHSHNEKEVTNDNIFPGGMMTMLVVEPWTVNLDTEGGSGTVRDEIVLPLANLAITKTNNVASVSPGQALTYTIVVTNFGPSPVTGALVTDTRPAALTGTGSSWSWSCAPATATGCGTSGNSGTGNISKTLGTLASGSSAVFTVNATVASNAAIGGTLANTATVTAAGITDPNLANNTVTDSDPIVAPSADLSITVTNNRTSVFPGQAQTYAIVVTNIGPNSVTGAVVADTRPSALTSWSWSCAANAGTSSSACNGTSNSSSSPINRTLGTLASGNSVTFTVTATVPSAAVIGTSLENTATVTAPVSGPVDPNTANNSATDSDPIVALLPATVGTPAGNPVTFTATNRGSNGQTLTVMTVANPSGNPSIGLSFAPSGDTAYWTRQTGNGSDCGSNLNANTSCNVRYRFNPPSTGSGGTAGAKSVTVTVSSGTNGATFTPITSVTLNGTAN